MGSTAHAVLPIFADHRAQRHGQRKRRPHDREQPDHHAMSWTVATLDTGGLMLDDGRTLRNTRGTVGTDRSEDRPQGHVVSLCLRIA
jgi:hypothetical protein